MAKERGALRCRKLSQMLLACNVTLACVHAWFGMRYAVIAMQNAMAREPELERGNGTCIQGDGCECTRARVYTWPVRRRPSEV